MAARGIIPGMLAAPLAALALAHPATAGCTLYAAPHGAARGAGRSPQHPLDLYAAKRRVRPGSVLCLRPGRYDLPRPVYLDRPGAAGAPVVLRPASSAVVLRRVGRVADDVLQVTAPYVRIEGLTVDGRGVADTAVKCAGAHHVAIVGNRLRDLGVGGVVAHGCDYVTVERNRIWHVGYGRGWSSGISLHEARWHDRAPGFHSLVVGNVVSGSTDDSWHHSDGNGIILDRSADVRAGTPPVLVANNVVFMNGGRCIEAYRASRAWIVNDTCYRNMLDRRVGRGCRCIGEVVAIRSRDVHVVNTVAAAWDGDATFVSRRSARVSFDHDARGRDARFADPPHVSAHGSQQQRTAPAPAAVGDGLSLTARSPLLDAGRDPRTLPGLDAEQRATMATVLSRDVDGAPRPQGAGFSVGAYER